MASTTQLSPQRVSGQGHVTYFLIRKAFGDGLVLLITIMSFNGAIKHCISHYFSNGTDTRIPKNVFLVHDVFSFYMSYIILCLQKYIVIQTHPAAL